MFIETISLTEYYYLNSINKFFTSKKYKSKIGSKVNPDALQQTLFFYNPINTTEKYIINIINSQLIMLELPMKNSNYYYKTYHNCLENTYMYLQNYINTPLPSKH